MTNTHRLLALAAVVLAGSLSTPPAFPQDDAGGTPDPEAAQLEALQKRAIPTVEKARGATFKEAVPVAPITREKFLDKYLGDMEMFLGGETKVEPSTRLLRRLGAIGKDEDLLGILEVYLPSAVGAIYDYRTKTVSFLPGNPGTLPTMVHEMTHAIDDQEFDFESQIPAIQGEFDRGLAFGSIVEGDALSVEQRFQTAGMIANVPLDNLRQMAASRAAMVLEKENRAPPAIAIAFISQYTEGIVFAEALRRGPQGEKAVDEALRHPPVSTEQVLHPEKYQDGENPVSITFDAVPEGAKILVDTTFGELGSRILLLGRKVPQADAMKAAAGWAGDRVALVSFPGGHEAVIWVADWDTPSDAEEFRTAQASAYPVSTGTSSDEMTRGFVAEGKTVIYVEAPLAALADAMAMAKGATHKTVEATPHADVLAPPPAVKKPDGR